MKNFLLLQRQTGECSSVGRTSASQAEGRGFEPRYSLMGLDFYQGEGG